MTDLVPDEAGNGQSARRLIIVSGVSGAGKSIVLHALEDGGFFCVDNLPVGLLLTFAREIAFSDLPHYREVAIGVDARSPVANLMELPNLLEQLKQLPLTPELIFIEATRETLIQRFSETRRRHPLSDGDTPLPRAIDKELEVLEPIKACADLCIDTSNLNVHQLRELIGVRVARRRPGSLVVQILSFGYKKGLPRDADLVFDARCLPNPYWDPALRPLTGRDGPVGEFLAHAPDAAELIDTVGGFLQAWIPRFAERDRSYLTIAFGCTGGRHRSVYVAEAVAKYLRDRGIDGMVRHRDL